MNTLKINIPEGFKVKKFDEKTGEVTFEPIPKDIKELINGIDDIFKLNGITESEFNKKWEGFEPYFKAHAFELLIVAAYNEGKQPDFTDGSYKYCPYFKMGSPSGVGFSYHDCVYWLSHSFVGARQLFCGPNAKENMLDAVDKFLPQYKESRNP